MRNHISRVSRVQMKEKDNTVGRGNEKERVMGREGGEGEGVVGLWMVRGVGSHAAWLNSPEVFLTLCISDLVLFMCNHCVHHTNQPDVHTTVMRSFDKLTISLFTNLKRTLTG